MTLNAVPKILSVGAGCKKGTATDKFERFFCQVLDEEGISPLAVESISSIDLKKDEECMTGLAEKLEVPFITYSAEDLDGAGKADSGGYEFDESDFVRRTTGTGNVCERSAFLSSGRGKIIVKKRSEGGMTLAVAIMRSRYRTRLSLRFFACLAQRYSKFSLRSPKARASFTASSSWGRSWIRR